MEAQPIDFETCIHQEAGQLMISSILFKVGQARQTSERISVITIRDFKAFLSENECNLIDQLFALDPRTYGFLGPRLESEPVPDKLIRVAGRPFMRSGVARITHLQFVPEPPYTAFQRMAEAMEADLGRPLLIESSYRSQAFQAITFLSILKSYNYDLPTTARRVAVPGYSEHNTPGSLAFDVLNIDGLPSDETPQDFANTAEYDWLNQHAASFNFYLSYPVDNPDGVMFEPWHWRYIPSETRL